MQIMNLARYGYKKARFNYLHIIKIGEFIIMRSKIAVLLCSAMLLSLAAPFGVKAEEIVSTATSSDLLHNRIESYFTGLSEGDTLSEAELLEKKELASYLSEIIETEIEDTKSITSYGDPKNKYILGQVICSADNEENAKRVAAAYDGTLINYSYGVAVIALPRGITTAQALVAAADESTKLPAVWPNERYRAKDAESSDTSNEEIAQAAEDTTEVSDNVEPVAEEGEEAALDENASGEETMPEENPNKKNVLSRQWMHRVLGDEKAWENGFKGQNVKVAVIDTGIFEGHEDIAANVEQGRYFGDGFKGEKVQVDITGHGSHVAGIIAADDNDFMGTGVAPDSTVGSFLAFDLKGRGRASDIVRAVNAAVEDGSYNIINLSLGGYSYNGVFAKAIKNAYNNGVIVFAAAGNESSDEKHYPSDYEGAFSVASINKRGKASKFTNYGENIDFAFPGENIYSIDGKKSRRYVKLSGTSMATAVASGVAAIILSSDETLLKEKNPDTVDKVIKIMRDSALKTDTEELGSIVTYLPKALNIE